MLGKFSEATKELASKQKLFMRIADKLRPIEAIVRKNNEENSMPLYLKMTEYISLCDQAYPQIGDSLFFKSSHKVINFLCRGHPIKRKN